MRRALQIIAALALAGCDGAAPPDDIPDAGRDAGALADVGATEDAGACEADPMGDPLACESLEPDPSCEARWTVGVRGRVIALEGGAGVADARPQLCARVAPDNRLVCLVPPTTDAEGEFTIVVPEEIRCLERAAMRVVAPRQPLGAVYCPFALEGTEPVIALEEAFALPATAPAEVPPEGDPAAPREVRFPGGVTLTLAPDALLGADAYERLAGGPVPVEATACFAEGRPLLGAYTFTPEGTLATPAAVALPNDAGLPPGASVDLYVLGGLDTRLVDGTPVEEAELARFGAGTVSADGARIVSDEASLPYLSTVAWQAR